MEAAELLSQAVQPRKREQGIVKWFDASRGYGFIQRREGEADIFVHFSAIQTKESYKTLSPDQPVVEFELGSSKTGPIAVNVVPLL
jgi:cold shock protein